MLFLKKGINRPMLWLYYYLNKKQATFFFKNEPIILTSATVELVQVKNSTLHLLEMLTKEQDVAR